MANHKINVSDEATTADQAGQSQPVEQSKYEVRTGLFKNGKQYKKGSTIELDKQTAKRFIASNDVKEKK